MKNLLWRLKDQLEIASCRFTCGEVSILPSVAVVSTCQDEEGRERGREREEREKEGRGEGERTLREDRREGETNRERGRMNLEKKHYMY